MSMNSDSMSDFTSDLNRREEQCGLIDHAKNSLENKTLTPQEVHSKLTKFMALWNNRQFTLIPKYLRTLDVHD